MAATWGDVVSLIIISTIFFGAIAAFVYVTESAKRAAGAKDEELKAKGIHVTTSGIAIKTDKQAPTQGKPEIARTDKPLYGSIYHQLTLDLSLPGQVEDLIEKQSRAFLKGGEALARPGVVSAGKQASFRDDRSNLPSAFEAPTNGSETEEQKKTRFRRHRGKEA